MLLMWNELTTCEMDKLNKQDAVAVLVVGSCEQHACHLPLGTDTILGDAIVKAAAEKATGAIVMLPSVPYGFSKHHMDFSGTVSLEQSELATLVGTIFKMVHDTGFDKLAVINAHGGNSAALHYALNELGSEYGIKLIFVKYWDFAAEYIASHWRETPLGGIGHAGEMETALMMQVAPELVRQEKIIDYQLPKGGNGWFHSDMFAKNSVVMYNNFNIYSPDGNVGMAQYASADKGKLLFDYCTDRLAEFLDGFWVDNPYT